MKTFLRVLIVILAVHVCVACSPGLSDRGVRWFDGRLEYGLALCPDEQVVKLVVVSAGVERELQVDTTVEGPGLSIATLLGDGSELDPEDLGDQFEVYATTKTGPSSMTLRLPVDLSGLPDDDTRWRAGEKHPKEDAEMEARGCPPS